METSNLIICLTTVATVQDADQIAGKLIESSLAACVQIDGPIRSHYRWQGQNHCDQEYRLVIKTTNEVAEVLQARLLDIHPYDEPQFLCLSVAQAAQGYENWVNATVAGRHPDNSSD